MLSRLVLVTLFLLLSVSWTSAQVEFDVEVFEEIDLDSFRALSPDTRTVVDYLLLIQEQDFCTAHNSPLVRIDFAVCVVEDARVLNQYHLYVGPAYSIKYAVYYEGQVVALLKGDDGVEYLPGGDYILRAFAPVSLEYNRRFHNLVATISFTIGQPDTAQE